MKFKDSDFFNLNMLLEKQKILHNFVNKIKKKKSNKKEKFRWNSTVPFCVVIFGLNFDKTAKKIKYKF